MKTVAIIQARMSSTRLPGKVLLPLDDKTVLAHVIERARLCRKLDSIVLATTVEPEDDLLVAESEKNKVGCYRGSREDVLSRYYGAAVAAQAELVVRITSDCPLFDPFLLEQMLEAFETKRGQVDYLSNTLVRSYPRGLDAEIFPFAALKQANENAHELYEREHVTPYLYQHPELFRLHSYQAEQDLSSHRWTLDTPEDLQFIRAIYEALGRSEGLITTQAVLNLLKKAPALARINAHIEQKKLQDSDRNR